MALSSRAASFGLLALPLVITGMLTLSTQLLWAGVAIGIAAILVRLIVAFR